MDTIETIKNEVLEMMAKIEKQCESEREFKEIYKGFQIFFSPLVKRADIMFLGINPGGGAYKYSGGKIPHEVEPLNENAYVNNEFKLAMNWRYMFEKDFNRLDLLEKSFKTNCYFVATFGEEQLKEILKIISKHLGNEFELKSREWTRKLIEYVCPRIIICEGIVAYKQLQKCFKKDEFKQYDDWNSNYGFLIPTDSEIRAFARRYSDFKSEDEIVGEMREIIKDL